MHKIKSFRRDALDKVTGAAKYSGDFQMDGMLYAKILWPPVPSCRILSIHTEKAAAAPGVARVITRADITGPNLAAVFEPYDRPVLVGEGEPVRFAADALALVVAESEDEAARALGLIEVAYEETPAAHTVEQARDTQEPCFEKLIQKGDVAADFSRADLVLEGEYETPYAEHAYIEPEAGYAYVDNDGTINVCYGSQNLGRHHRMICKSLGLPFHKVRLCAPYIGGAFGGKQSFSVQVYLTLMAHLLRRPVRLVWTREESMQYGCKRHLLKTRVRMGLDSGGHILAYQAEIDAPAAPYYGYSRNTLDFFSRYLCGPYRYESLDIRGLVYYTTGAEAGAYRGFGGPDATYITETMLDRAAKALEITPLEIRKINWMRENEEFDQQFPDAPWRNMSDRFAVQTTLEKALEAAGPLTRPAPGKKVGRGIANAIPCFCIGNTPGYKGTGADLVMFLDGTLLVRLGYPEAGQGISGVAAAIASQVMELPEEKINVMLCDSHLMPKAGSLGFSQATVNAGNAIVAAAERLKKQLEDIAREYLKSDDPEIRYREGGFYRNGEKLLDWAELSDYCYYEGKNLTATGWTVAPDDKDRHGVTPISAVADVEVDPETGEVRVLQIVNCHDSGKVIHYDSARGQIIGGALMCIGNTLMEEFIMEEGRARTPSFAEYLIPTAMDTPEQNKAVFLENYGEDCPLGAKGMGEHPLYATGPAIANAIYQAVGVCMTETPITPERLLRRMGKI